MALGINDISSGMGLSVDGKIFMVVDYSHVKPGKGSAFVRARLRDVKTDAVIERTFRSSEKLDEVPLEERRLEYLYHSGHAYHFMDQTSYEEAVLNEEELGNVPKFLLDNMQVFGIYNNNKILKVMLPNFIEAEIIESEPGIKGDSSRSGNKPATIATGAIIQVPLFINKGDWIRIDTRKGGEYVERLQK